MPSHLGVPSGKGPEMNYNLSTTSPDEDAPETHPKKSPVRFPGGPGIDHIYFTKQKQTKALY